MTPARITKLLIRHWTTIMWFGVLGVLLAVGMSFLVKHEYRASIRLLVTQESASSDAYTASRSAERLADDLAGTVYYTAFFDQVLDSNFAIDEDQFSSLEDNAAKRRKEWNRMISTSVERGSGRLGVDIYNEDPSQAKQIAQAVAFVLTQQGWRYTSAKNISVRLVDEPLVSRFPVRPNFAANALIGLVLGGIFGGGFVLIKSETLRRRRGV